MTSCRRHGMEMLAALLVLCDENPVVIGKLSSRKTLIFYFSDQPLWYLYWIMNPAWRTYLLIFFQNDTYLTSPPQVVSESHPKSDPNFVYNPKYHRGSFVPSNVLHPCNYIRLNINDTNFVETSIPIVLLCGNKSSQFIEAEYISVSRLTIIGSDNGLSPERRQAII